MRKLVLALIIFFCCEQIFAQTGIPKAEDWHWEKYENNPVLTPGDVRDWDGGRVYPGTVLKINNVYHMWYFGIDFRYSGYNCIGYAKSSDGKNWIKYEGNPVLVGDENFPNELNVGAPEVYYDGLIFHMWYWGYQYDWKGTIGYAISSDGVNWIKSENNPVLPLGDGVTSDNFMIAMPSVIHENNAFRMWYVAGSSSNCENIGMATSSDGMNWEKNIDPIMELCANEVRFVATNVLEVGGNYYMWYTEGPWGAIQSALRIKYAYSSNGLEWTQTPDHFVLEDSLQSQDWDKLLKLAPTILYNEDDNIYEMWYGGSKDDDHGYSIGYAWAENPLDSTTQISDIEVFPRKYFLSQNYPNPFNPTTTIKYTIAEKSGVRSQTSELVTLKIYDILGREVTTLVNKQQRPGNYEVIWDANEFPSGIYLYKISAGKYKRTKKLMLIK